ncbi:hypothetical protein KKG45_06085 [bacterium]|nr:hypothetical protein [bacterium]MBU1072796.1 hypothetical protein [bacterium]MBU1676757.1 hypothetical protein [bacterium]
MNTLKFATLLVLLTLATTACALDQEGGVRLLLATPTGEFGDAVGTEGGGLEIHYGLRPRPSFTFGLGLNAMIYGSETRTCSLPLVEDFDLTTSNNLAGAFLFAQWRPLTGAVQPYAEARVGLGYLWTESKLEDEDWWDGDEVARQTNYDDFATFWGGAGGLLIRLSEGNRDEKKPGVFLDLKVSHLQGGEAEYLTEGDITIVDNVPVYAPSCSETDLTAYQLGVVLTF